MQKEIELKCLCDGLLDALREMGLGKYSLRNYYYEGMWPLIKAYRKAGKELYDPVFTNEVVLGIQKQFQEGLVGNHISMHVRKMAALMEEYSLNRCIVWHRIKPCPAIQLSAYYEYIILGFKFWEEERKVRTPKGIQSFVGIARKFFRYLEMNGHSLPKTITLKLVSGFLLFVAPQHKGSMERVLSALKNLCEYMLGCTDCIDFRPALMARPSQRKKLMPVFSTQEVVAITESAMKYSSLSKRDTAVFAIAQSVGLRAIDIVNLKLVNINWNSHEIRFCQHKTGVELVLPLEPAVGNAIADYILNERPKAQSEFLFVRARFPYGAMTSNAVGDRLRLHMRKAEMNYASGCHKGFHKVVEFMSLPALEALFLQPNTKNTTGFRDFCFMILMYDVAARCQELLDLRIGDLELQQNTPSVYLTGKGTKMRKLPISTKVAGHLKNYLNTAHPAISRKDEDFLFYTISHGHRNKMSSDAVSLFMRKYGETGKKMCSEIPDRVHPHQLRHSRAMHLYRGGMPLVLLSEFLGHADVNTTRIYAWADTEMKRQAIQKITDKCEANATIEPIWENDEQMIKRLYGLA